ncbi:hypothetical protein N7532_002263 [Penicillium argentinense]|uniref:Opsin n=1 Tax=Penicillium argentinense TaxID=1131581 RepID=A0A9W9KLB6_9EURO|nr:uncharacterized protein N7532_002263 [Penicillium argentinense]KAJ5109618.1 hypothetical protein N7532_002263 [Penicillium argentinense]
MMLPNPDEFPTGTLPSWPPANSIDPIPTVIPGEPIFQELQTTGKRTLWVVTVLMGLTSLVFYTLAARAPLSKRIFHTLSAFITTISFITYLALSTGQGSDYVFQNIVNHHKHVPNTEDEYFRQVLWLRYLNWALSTPLILTNFALVSGVPGANLVSSIVANWVMLASGLLGTYAGHTKVRWVWLVVSCVAYLTVLHHGGFHAHRASLNKDAQTRRFFGALAGSTLTVFALFPIALAAGPLALKLSVDTETVIFAVQDIFTQGLIGYWLLLAHDSSPGITVHIGGFWSNGVGNEGAIHLPEEGA